MTENPSLRLLRYEQGIAEPACVSSQLATDDGWVALVVTLELDICFSSICRLRIRRFCRRRLGRRGAA